MENKNFLSPQLNFALYFSFEPKSRRQNQYPHVCNFYAVSIGNFLEKTHVLKFFAFQKKIKNKRKK